MSSVIYVIFLVLAIVGILYTILVITGTDNFKGINLQLDDFFTDNEKMTLAVIEKLRNQGKECEITKLSKSFSEVIVEGKKYYVSARVTNMGSAPVQTIQLKPIK